MPLDSDWSEATRDWRPPSEVAGVGPREVRLNAKGKLLVGMVVFLLAAGVFFYAFLSRQMGRQMADRSALDASGVETEAAVTRLWHDGGKSETPMVAYRFQYDGRIYHGSTSAPGAQWKNLAVGVSIPVRFVPANPLINHPSAWEMHVMPKWAPYTLTATFSVIGLLLVFLVRRDQQLLREGRAAPGRVTAHRRVKGGIALLYEYRAPDGTVHKGRGGQSQTPPKVGSIITVMYDAENPKRNSPYPMELSRIVR